MSKNLDFKNISLFYNSKFEETNISVKRYDDYSNIREYYKSLEDHEELYDVNYVIKVKD
jgi:hypothetical protein